MLVDTVLPLKEPPLNGKIGMDEVYESRNSVFDVIFVHGIGGKDWPAEEERYHKLLSERQPPPRILTYGYDSSVWRTTSATCIEEAARELLSKLEGTDSKVKPKGKVVSYITGD
ncbi:hypothetical protein MMC11_007404 [Xylographa trunciseda]|nr:hypothetical protein [Xylographa trunciseda]